MFHAWLFLYYVFQVMHLSSDSFVTQLDHNANVIYSELKWIMNPLHRFYYCVLLPDKLYHYGDDFHSFLD